jgi:hypothetical protein
MASFTDKPEVNAYRADCVAPVKDTRVQTEVSISAGFFSLSTNGTTPTQA